LTGNQREVGRERNGMDDEHSRLVDTLPGLIWIARADARVEFVNRRWWEYTGLGIDALAQGFQAAVHPQDMPTLEERWPLLIGSAKFFEMEVRLRRTDGQYHWFLVRSCPLPDAHGKIEKWCGINTDIEDRKRAEKAEETLGEVRSELAHLTRVASLGALTASIAHEVNQPLSGIITNAHTCLRMLATESPNIDGARETARRTIRDGNRASDVVTRLRAMFAKRALVSESVDLNEAAREVLALSRRELQRGQVVVCSELADGLPSVIGDRLQLQQVILHLLLNASAAMSDIEDRPRTLSLKTECENDDYVRLTVRDVGVGLDRQATEQLFQAFYSTKPDGTGLGLSVSRSIIERHGGRLWALPNEHGPGAAFCFVLPRVVPPGAPVQARVHG
jgi:PAS domain S-box-containing protein